MKYLLQAIEAKRATVKLNDTDLRKLLTEVRKGRDEREEFLESIDRILTELRNYSEHSAAFLAKVSKRDAPDYYDVIKHPMDLGTMQKKVKAGQYKNKKQFAHDLDLIWDNCLLYNSDPIHPLRRNVQFMRKKANHLLEFISDKSDVKDALIQWQINERRTQSPASFSAPVVVVKRDFKDVPFDQRAAFVRTGEGMKRWIEIDQALVAGPSSRPMMEALKQMREHSPLDPLTATCDQVFKSTKGKGKETPAEEEEEDQLEEITQMDVAASWWTASTSDEMMCAGFPALISSERLNERPSKRKRPLPPTRRPGLQGQISRNIRTIKKVQETHGKFLSLAHLVENESPIPAYLTQVSSDEESDDYPSGDESDEPDEAHHPFAHVTSDSARDMLAHTSQTILAHHGFEGAHRAPSEVLTSVLSELILNLGRTLRIYSDRYAHKMSAEEIILHSLLESGNTDIPSLESYIRDDVERYGSKMADLLRKLRGSYKEQLAVSMERGVVEDDALFEDGGEALMSGNFAEGLGDDFFGFRELGLDVGMVPSRLFHGRMQATTTVAATGTEKEPPLPYPPPPPYIPLTSSGISAQIRLLQPWYADKLREDGTLPDEEQEKQRYKVPPNGKLPKRIFVNEM